MDSVGKGEMPWNGVAGLPPDWEARLPRGEAALWLRPSERARAAVLGIISELSEGVPDLDDGPLKAEGTGLLLPLPPPCWTAELKVWSLYKAGLAVLVWDVPEDGFGLGVPITCIGVERPGGAPPVV